MADVSIQSVVKRFGSVEVLHGIDLEIEGGQLTVLLGPSGCGKSTLLRLVAGLEDASSGDIAIDGEVVNDVSPVDRGCAMVFQNYALYPHQTVYKNMAFPLKMAGMDRATIDRKVRETARLLDLEDYLQRLPRDLSGGQRQRVAMGRAMIREPKVFLFDEPLSNLDAELRVRMRLEITRLQQSLGATMVFVTHDQVEAMTLAHKIVVMRDGRIEQHGTPLEIYRKPASRFVAGFIGSPAMNMIEIDRTEPSGEQTRLALRDGTSLVLPYRLERQPQTLGVRPEHVRFARNGAATELGLGCRDYRLLGVEHLGDRSYRYLAMSFGELTVLGCEDFDPDAEEKRDIVLDPRNLHFFDASGRAVAVT